MALFGTSGIRDLCPSAVSPALALFLASIYCRKTNYAAVGYDGRATGQMLKAAFSSGAAQVGVNVLDIGVCATPTLSLFCKIKNCAGAQMTASHNPPQYNGIKLFDKGLELERKKEEKIEKELEKCLGKNTSKKNYGEWKTSPPEKNYANTFAQKNIADWKSAGAIENHEEEAKSRHLSLLLSKISRPLISSKRPRVVLDCANMAACSLMPAALKAAGCEVVPINCRLGEPYGREFEPNEKSLSALSEKVKSANADLGIAHDGDADRAIVCDESGKVLGLDVQLALAAKEALSNSKNAKKETIVSTVESSLSLSELVSSYNAKLEITPVGSLHVARKMRQKNALFGGEPCGEYIFHGATPSPDGLMAGLYFVQMFCSRGPLSAQARQIPAYPIARLKIPCKNEKKKIAMQKIKSKWPFSKPSTFDGLRVAQKDWWLLVRPSGTEPCIRITSEAKDKSLLDEKVVEMEKIVQAACK